MYLPMDRTLGIALAAALATLPVQAEEAAPVVPPDIEEQERERERMQRVDDIFAALGVENGSWGLLGFTELQTVNIAKG